MLYHLSHNIRSLISRIRSLLFLEGDNTTIRILLFAAGIIYFSVGIIYYQQDINSHQLLFINLACGVLFLTTFFLSFISELIRKNLHNIIVAGAYLIMFQAISEATAELYSFNNSIGLMVTYFVCGLVFRKSKQVYYFVIFNFLLICASTFFFDENEIKKQVILIVFFTQGLITVIALGAKLNIQEKLRRSNELFKLIFNDSTDANFLTDIDSLHIIDCNNKAVQMFEADNKSQLIGRQGLRLQLQPYSDEEIAEIKNQIKEQWGWSRELEYQTNKKNLIWGNLEARVVEYNNRPHLLVRISDITEKKRLEKMMLAEKMVLEMAYNDTHLQNTFRLLIQSVEEIAPEMRGAILRADYENERLNWLAAPNMPHDILERVPFIPISANSMPCGKSAMLRSAVVTDNIESGQFNQDIVDVFVEHNYRGVCSYPILAEDGTLLGTFCALFQTARTPTQYEKEIIERSVSITGLILEKDKAVSENKMAMEELRNKNHELQKTNSEIDSFVYSTSHDLRAPLLNVVGLIDLADMQIEESAPKAYFGLMKESIYKLDDTIKEIIDYYRNKKIEVTYEEVDLTKLAKEAFNNFRFMEEARQVEMFFDIDTTTPFYSDPKRITVILNNLISNSIKFRDPKKEHSFICIRSTVTADKAILEVEDNGMGIEENHLDNIFGMFYRATSASYGSGLGLYILNEVVTRLEGKISVNSEAGKGTTFTIELQNHKLARHARKSVYI